MEKVVVYENPDGTVSVVHPIPWARLVTYLKDVDGKEYNYDPPARLESVTNIRDVDRYYAFLEDLDKGIISVVWESEEDFCNRLVNKTVPVMETEKEVEARVANAKSKLDLNPFPRPTGVRVRVTVPEGVRTCIVNARDLPKGGRELREAWKLEGSQVVLDEDVIEEKGLRLERNV